MPVEAPVTIAKGWPLVLIRHSNQIAVGRSLVVPGASQRFIRVARTAPLLPDERQEKSSGYNLRMRSRSLAGVLLLFIVIGAGAACRQTPAANAPVAESPAA